jgi:hypothetical protein
MFGGTPPRLATKYEPPERKTSGLQLGCVVSPERNASSIPSETRGCTVLLRTVTDLPAHSE